MLAGGHRVKPLRPWGASRITSLNLCSGRGGCTARLELCACRMHRCRGWRQRPPPILPPRDLAAHFDGDTTESERTNGAFLLLSGMSWTFEAACYSHSTSHLLCRSRGIVLRLSIAYRSGQITRICASTAVSPFSLSVPILRLIEPRL